jgi:hypothetical protein
MPRSVKASVVALTVLSAALLQHFRPGHTINDDAGRSPASDRLNTLAGITVSIWDTILPSHSIATAGPKEIDQATSTPLATVPDLQLIKHALSTFTAMPAEESITVTPVPDRAAELRDTNRRRLEAFTACKALSTRSVRQCREVALTIPSQVVSTPFVKPISILPPHQVIDTGLPNCVGCSGHIVSTNITGSHVEGCGCASSHQHRNEVINRLLSSLRPATRYTISATRYLDHVFAPAYVELQKEMNELVALGKTFLETSSTLSQFMIHRAARGLTVSRHALNRLSNRLRRYIPLPVPSNVKATPDSGLRARKDTARARASMDILQEYVEASTTALGDYVEEQAILLQEKGMESLNKARKGLDRLIAEARHAVEGVEALGEDEKARHWTSQTLPKVFDVPELGATKRSRRSRMERDHAIRRKVHHRAERSSRGRKLWDAFHHVSQTDVYTA